MSSKLRDALESLINVSQHLRCGSKTDCEKCTVAEVCSLTNAILEAKSALAEPLRNCDVGTAEEQGARFRGFCDKHNCERCPVGGDEYLTNCFSRWAQMPYEEGESK